MTVFALQIAFKRKSKVPGRNEHISFLSLKIKADVDKKDKYLAVDVFFHEFS